MNSNVLVAIKNIIQIPFFSLLENYFNVVSSNRINSMGDALEFYIRDIFSSSLKGRNELEKMVEYDRCFSYLGNKSNPPDLMIRNGDAIEIKKLESINSDLALNSSYPKNTIRSDDAMITSVCKNCEEWKEKDLLYVVGSVSKSDKRKLSSLNFVYGNCYAANFDVYKKIKTTISNSISTLENVELVKTNELAKVKRVDPLGITTLRVRGMWHTQNPNKVFDYIFQNALEGKFVMNALILKDKYFSFPQKDRIDLELLLSDKFFIKDVKIKSPNNPAQLLDAKLLTYIV